VTSEPPGEHVDRLYGLPPDEFTSERNELAKRLRSEAKPDEAAAVKALKKPSLPAWTINQLSRRHSKELRRLLDAGDALRKAHAGLPSRGGREKLRAATDKERELVSKLVERARPLLSEAGKPCAANLERVRNTLHAAAADVELRAELEAGRVAKDRESVGLGPLGLGAPGRPGKQEQQRAAARRRELRDARSKATAAAKRLQAAEAALERARTDAEQAERDLRDRQRSLEAARREAVAADEELDLVESRD
jgi:hypothetical protein